MFDKLHYVQLAFSMVLMISALCLFFFDGSILPWIGAVIGLVGGLVCHIIRMKRDFGGRGR